MKKDSYFSLLVLSLISRRLIFGVIEISLLLIIKRFDFIDN
jgi:hypothetical protein